MLDLIGLLKNERLSLFFSSKSESSNSVHEERLELLSLPNLGLESASKGFLGISNSSILFLKIGEAWKLSTTSKFELLIDFKFKASLGICKKFP